LFVDATAERAVRELAAATGETVTTAVRRAAEERLAQVQRSRGGRSLAFDLDQAEIAWLAWRRFGKGRHPAGLNYGDCFVYALAKSRRLPILFCGDDFTQTDIDRVRLD
jgi:ribonuclease VapC